MNSASISKCDAQRLWVELKIQLVEMITLVDVSKACDGLEKSLREGEHYFRSGLMCVGVTERQGTVVKCVGMAAQTPGVLQNPHKVECDVDTNEDEGTKILRLNCTCPGGNSGRCEHCIALLIYLNRVEAADLDDLTHSALEQRWEVIKESHKKTQALNDIAELCQSETQEKLSVSKEMRDKWRRTLMNCK